MQEDVYRRAELGDHRSYVGSGIPFGLLNSEIILMIKNLFQNRSKNTFPNLVKYKNAPS